LPSAVRRGAPAYAGRPPSLRARGRADYSGSGRRAPTAPTDRPRS